MITRRSVLIGGLSSPLFFHKAKATEIVSELELCLLFDCSSSMSNGPNDHLTTNALIQKRGHIEALRTPELANALVKQRAFVRVIKWNDTAKELYGGCVSDEHSLEQLIKNIDMFAPTSGTGATLHDVGVKYVLGTQPRGERRVIDISTDEGIYGTQFPNCIAMRELAMKQQVQINLLTIGIPELEITMLKKNLCTRDGFIHQIKDWSSYAEAIRDKMLLEVA